MAFIPSHDPLASATVEEYLTRERAAAERHEYLDGCVYAMAGESPDHGRICVNLTASPVSRLRGTPCEVFSKDMQVRCGPMARAGHSRQGLGA